MWNVMRIAASGMKAQQGSIDVVANNLANLGTAGFKVRRPALLDLPAETAEFGEQQAQVGQGVLLQGMVTNHAVGAPRATGRALDLAIDGPGFLKVTLSDGRAAYTRDGGLGIDGSGRLLAAGAPLDPPISVPTDAHGLSIQPDGSILAQISSQLPSRIGQLTLARFTNPDGLEAVGQNLLVATAASGTPLEGAPGTN